MGYYKLLSLIYILFVITSICLSNAFKRFDDILWERGSDFMTKNTVNGNYYNYLLQYISKNKLAIKIKNVALTKNNAFSLTIIFIITKTVPYLLNQYVHIDEVLANKYL